MNKLIDYKRTYIASDGDEYVYMGSPAYDIEKLTASNIVKSNQDHCCRIDKFAINNDLTDPDDIDLIMYINHIYNPFAINENDVLYIPKSDDYYYQSEEPTLIDGNKLSESESETSNKSYADTVDYLAKLGLGIK